METSTKSVLAAILAAERTLAFGSFAVMLTALIVDVLGRELLGQGVFGSVRVAVYGLIICALAGFGIATATGAHLRPKFLDRLLPRKHERVGVRIGQLVSVAILLTLAKASWDLASFTREINERDVTLGWLVWPMQMAMPAAFFLSAVRYMAYAIFPNLTPDEAEIME